MDIQKRVLKTLEFFALQQAAVTLLEVWRFLVRDSSELEASVSGHSELIELPELENRTAAVAEVLHALAMLMTESKVVEHLGYYTLRDRATLLRQRWLGYQYGVWREKRIRRYIGFLKYIPFVWGVALAGSQPLGLQKKDSDIDLLNSTTPGWLWLPRTLITGYFQLMGIRRYGSYVSNRFCLNHYLSGTKQMTTGRNWYTALEYGKLRPLVGEYSVREFQVRNVQWLNAFFPNISSEASSRAQPLFIQRLLEFLFNNPLGKGFERILGAWQSKRIHQNQPHIIVAADELSFHPDSKQDPLLKSFSS